MDTINGSNLLTATFLLLDLVLELAPLPVEVEAATGTGVEVVDEEEAFDAFDDMELLDEDSLRSLRVLSRFMVLSESSLFERMALLRLPDDSAAESVLERLPFFSRGLHCDSCQLTNASISVSIAIDLLVTSTSIDSSSVCNVSKSSMPTPSSGDRESTAISNIKRINK